MRASGLRDGLVAVGHDAVRCALRQTQSDRRDPDDAPGRRGAELHVRHLHSGFRVNTVRAVQRLFLRHHDPDAHTIASE